MAFLIFFLVPLMLLPSSFCVLNGTVARSESVAFLASVRRKIEDSNKFGDGHRCGGTLITQDVVITASSCLTAGTTHNFQRPSSFRVVGGDTIRTEHTNHHHVSDVCKIVHHDKANQFTGQHNLALVTMTTPVSEQHRTFHPIFMADNQPADLSVCTFAGWGSTTEDRSNKSFSNEALIGNVTVFNYKNCTTIMSLLPAGAICYTWNETAGACLGDEGGPLIFEGRLVGVLQRMANCNVDHYPGFVVDVYQHLTWINENMYRIEDHVMMNGVSLIVLWEVLLLITVMVVLAENILKVASI